MSDNNELHVLDKYAAFYQHNRSLAYRIISENDTFTIIGNIGVVAVRLENLSSIKSAKDHFFNYVVGIAVDNNKIITSDTSKP